MSHDVLNKQEAIDIWKMDVKLQNMFMNVFNTVMEGEMLELLVVELFNMEIVDFFGCFAVLESSFVIYLKF